MPEARFMWLPAQPPSYAVSLSTADFTLAEFWLPQGLLQGSQEPLPTPRRTSGPVILPPALHDN